MTAQERADIKAKTSSTSFAIKLPLSTIPTMLVSPNHSVSIIQRVVEILDRVTKRLQTGELYSPIFSPGNFITSLIYRTFLAETDQ